jgi:hypothetical protein
MARKMDIAWREYIEKTNIQLTGKSHFVNAKKLKEITKQEPRILAKIDEPSKRPKVFRDAGYSLLAVKNGEYVIFQGSTFGKVSPCQERRIFSPRLEFPLETAGRGTGESEYLDNAFNVGIISEFTENKTLYLTIRGRERTSSFDFSFENNNSSISVSGVQIEVDAGFEGENEIILVEAKIGARTDFNIRQIYYPYRHFKQLVPEKRIRNLFFTYDLTQATYSLYEFDFINETVFDSIELINCATYSLVAKEKYRIDELLDESFESKNNIIPQADDLNKVLEVLALTNTGQNSTEEIADYFAFDVRQSNYYREAANSIGLIIRPPGFSELTSLGQRFIEASSSEQQLFAAKAIVNSWFFRKLIDVAKQKGYFTEADIEDVIISAKNNNRTQRYTTSTIPRRRQTLVSWAKWLAEQFDCFQIKDNEYHLT